MSFDNKEYPFQSNYFETEFGKLHYIDEGKGDVILFIHGTPTWSFLYRNYIKSLSKEYRCIAIDNLGFGLSDKSDKFDGTPESHNLLLTNFINEMNLQNINLVVHDFGGVIGLPYALENIKNVNKVIISNTWLWSNEDNKDVIKIDKILKSFIGKILYLNMNFSVKVLMKKSFYNKSIFDKKLMANYLHPFPNRKSRFSLYKIALSLLGSSKWYDKYWQKITLLNNKNTLFVWGIKDEFISSEYLLKWQNILPKAEYHIYSCGHFIQEENFVESLETINNFLSR